MIFRLVDDPDNTGRLMFECGGRPLFGGEQTGHDRCRYVVRISDAGYGRQHDLAREAMAEHWKMWHE